jgi:hypothetical protein
LRVVKRPPPDVRVVFWIRVPVRAPRQAHGILEEITEAREALHACGVNQVRNRSLEDPLVVPEIEVTDRLRPMNDLAIGITDRASGIGLHCEKRGGQLERGLDPPGPRQTPEQLAELLGKEAVVWGGEPRRRPWDQPLREHRGQR